MKRFFVFILFLNLFLFSASASLVYKSSATASYYAEAFHGKKTSNGERFNMYSLTCAHKMLPFNTVLKVTNLRNGKTVQVRVNDRGPFVGTREIDLSKAAAVQLGMIGTGTAQVRLEILKLGSYTKQSVVTAKKACAKSGIKYYQVSMANENESDDTLIVESDRIAKIKSVKRNPGELWDIQVASFKSHDNALSYAKKVKKSGFKNVVIQKTSASYRVSLKEVSSSEVNSTVDKLSSKGYIDIYVRKRK